MDHWQATTRLCWLVLVIYALKFVFVAGVEPEQRQVQLAAQQLYPKHALLKISPTSTSSLQSALQSSATSLRSNAVLVLVDHGGSHEGKAPAALLVDRRIRVAPGQSVVITTPAALLKAAQDAAAGEAGVVGQGSSMGQQLTRQQLLHVQCLSSKDGGFLTASGASSVSLLGLSVRGCPSTAVSVVGGGSLLLQDVELLDHNWRRPAAEGGGLLIKDVSQVRLHRVLCSNNFAASKGGCLRALRVEQISLTNTTISLNKQNQGKIDSYGEGGAGLSLQLVKEVVLDHCQVLHNTALGTSGKGGGIQADLCGSVSVEHSIFRNNSATFEGGGLAAGDAGALIVTDSTFIGNGILPKADEETGEPIVTSIGGALDAFGSRSSDKAPVNVTVLHCRFEDNHADEGAGISITQWSITPGRAEIRDCLFVRNNATWNAGGAYMQPNAHSHVVVSNCQFINNTAGEFAGGLRIDDSDALVENCTFLNNEAGLEAGALCCLTELAAGSGNMLTLQKSIFVNNTCGQDGGAIAVENQGLQADDVLVQGSTAVSGAGAILLVSATKVVCRNMELKDNSCDQDAGGLGVQAAKELTLENVTISGNQGVIGGGVQLLSVGNALLSQITVTGNSASHAGGGIAIKSCNNVTISNSSISNNSACIGGGVGADRTHLVLDNVLLDANTAEQRPPDAEEDAEAGAYKVAEEGTASEEGYGSRRLLLQQLKPQEAAEQYAVQFMEFASVWHLQGTAGAALVQHSAITLVNSNLRGNTAAWSAGGLLLQHPVKVSMVNTAFDQNSAQQGPAGALLIRAPGWAGKLESCRFNNNSAAEHSGGAVMLDSGLGMFEVVCEGCHFAGNSAGQDGGAVAAVGPSSFDCVNCQSSHNKATFRGGFFSCNGCSSARMQSVNSSSNTASGPGGAVSCVDCGQLHILNSSYSSNLASAGGAVASRATAEVKVSGTTFDQNSAAANASGSAVVAADGDLLQLQVLDELPSRWQHLFAVVPSGSLDMRCRGGGSGGAVCAADTGTTEIDSTRLTANRGTLGGGMFISATCSSRAASAVATSATNSSTSNSCIVNLVNVSAADNVAGQGGGALYTSTAAALAVASSHDDVAAGAMVAGPAAGWGSGSHHSGQEQKLLQQLAAENQVLPGGYGPGAASLPSKLSLVDSAARSNAEGTPPPPAASYLVGFQHVSNPAATAWQVQQLQGRKLLQHASTRSRSSPEGGSHRHNSRRHLLQAASSSSSFNDNLIKGVATMYDMQSGASDAASAAGIELRQTCPALGATVLNDREVGVDANQAFALPVHIEDAFGSQVTAGPGSSWRVGLHQQGGMASAVQLSGASSGALSAGYVLLDNLTLAAQPGSDAVLSLTATSSWGSDFQPLSTSLNVNVRKCLPGQTAVISNSSSGSQTTTCLVCAAPSFSFSAYPFSNTSTSSSESSSSSSSSTCESCPSCGICVAGMIIPAPGCFMAHPRSSFIRACPHTTACQPGTAALHNLQGLQCQNRWQLQPEAIDPRPFTALQCSTGYIGPLCSSCYRPGRNKWVAQMLVQQQQVQGQHGFAFANQSAVLAEPWAGMDAGAAYGKTNGRCSSCPHVVAAWVSFLLARLLDMLFVALLALLWLILGWLSRSPVQAAYRRLKQQRFKELKFRKTLTLATTASMYNRSMRNMRSLKSMKSSRALGNHRADTFASNKSSSFGAGAASVTLDNEDESKHSAAAVAATAAAALAGSRQHGKQQQQLVVAHSNSMRSSLTGSGVFDQGSYDEGSEVLEPPPQQNQEQQEQEQQQLEQGSSSNLPDSLSAGPAEVEVGASLAGTSPEHLPEAPVNVAAEACSSQRRPEDNEGGASQHSTVDSSMAGAATAAATAAASASASAAAAATATDAEAGAGAADECISHAPAATGAAPVALSSMRSGSSSRLTPQNSRSFRSGQRVSFKSQTSMGAPTPPPSDTTATATAATAAETEPMYSNFSVSPFQMAQSLSAADADESTAEVQLMRQLSTPFGSASAAPTTTADSYDAATTGADNAAISPGQLDRHRVRAAGGTRHQLSIARRGSSMLSRVGSGGSRGNLSQGSNPDFYDLRSQFSLKFSVAVNMISHLQPPTSHAAAHTGVAGPARLGNTGTPGGAGHAGLPAAAAAAAAAEEAMALEAEQVASERAALLMMATRNLACMVQVVLDGAQIAAVVLAQDLMWRVPDWAAYGLSAVLMTQATTWQWVPFECLLPAGSTASGPVAQTILVLLLPVLYVLLLFPWMFVVVDVFQRMSNNLPTSHSTSALQLQEQQQQQQDLLQMQQKQQQQQHDRYRELLQQQQLMPTPSVVRRRSTSINLPRIQSEPLIEEHEGSVSSADDSQMDSPFKNQMKQQQQQLGKEQWQHQGKQQWPKSAGAQLVHAGTEAAGMTETGREDLGVSHSQLATCATTASDTPQQQRQQLERWWQRPVELSSLQYYWHQLWPLRPATWRLLAALSVAAMAYCYSFYAAAVVSAFTCLPLAHQQAPAIPGEFVVRGAYWVPDMQVQCWGRQHVGLVAVTVVIGLPLLAAYWWFLLVLAWPDEATAADGSGLDEQQQQQYYHQAPLWGAEAATTAGGVTASPFKAAAGNRRFIESEAPWLAQHDVEESIGTGRNRSLDRMFPPADSYREEYFCSADVSPMLLPLQQPSSGIQQTNKLQQPSPAREKPLQQVVYHNPLFGGSSYGGVGAGAAAPAPAPAPAPAAAAGIVGGGWQQHSGLPMGASSRWQPGQGSQQQQQQQQHVRPRTPVRIFLPAGTSSISSRSPLHSPLPQHSPLQQSPLQTPLTSSVQSLQLQTAAKDAAGSSCCSDSVLGTTIDSSWQGDPGPAEVAATAAASVPGLTAASIISGQEASIMSTGDAIDTSSICTAADAADTDDAKDGVGGTHSGPAPGTAATASSASASDAAGAAAGPSPAHTQSSQGPGCFSVLFAKLFALLCLPFQWLQWPVRKCQAYTHPVGISGTSVAGQGVWNQQYRWAWLLIRELLKFAIVLVAVSSTLRAASQTQALLLLMLVVMVAACTWGFQVGCSTSMERLLFVEFLWLQALALLVLVLTLPSVNGSVVGAVLLALLLAMVVQGVFVLGFLAWRCVLAGVELSRHALENETAIQEAEDTEDEEPEEVFAFGRDYRAV